MVFCLVRPFIDLDWQGRRCWMEVEPLSLARDVLAAGKFFFFELFVELDIALIRRYFYTAPLSRKLKVNDAFLHVLAQ